MAESSKSKEGQLGLSYPMLTKTNYTAWAIKMRVFMQAHNVWEAIDPKDPKVNVDDKVDKRALAMIYQGISEDLLLTLAERKTAKHGRRLRRFRWVLRRLRKLKLKLLNLSLSL